MLLPEPQRDAPEDIMAIADQTTAAALARRFAALLAGEPAVERLWYLAEPTEAPWANFDLMIWPQLATYDDDLVKCIDDVALRLQDEHQDVGIGLSVCMLDTLPDRNIAYDVEPEAVEILWVTHSVVRSAPTRGTT
jgi:hypothetical protein